MEEQFEWAILLLEVKIRRGDSDLIFQSGDGVAKSKHDQQMP